MEDTNDSQTVNNQTVSNGDNGDTLSITSAMGAMSSDEPAAKPGNGEKANGTEQTQTDDSSKSLPAWTSQLPDTIKGNSDVMKQLQKFEKIGDLANSYAELEKKLGKSVVTPGKDASAEEISAFYERIGKPKTADGYDITGESADDFKAIAFEANLTKAQAEAIFKGMGAYGTKIMEAQKANAERQLKETDEMLHKEYGNKYGEKIALLQRGVQAYGGKELGQLLNNAGIFYHPSIVKLFITLGEQSAESGSTSKGTGTGINQYKSTSEGGAFTFKGLN